MNRPRSIPLDLIPLGKIIKPHGIMGFLKVRLFNNNSDTLKVGQSVWIGLDPCKAYQTHIIEKLNLQNKKVNLKFKSINDRNEAELFRNFTLSVSRSEFREADADEFYIVDLIGFKVVSTDGKEIGIITDFMENPANEIIIISDGTKEHLVPLIDEFITFFDFENKQLTINLIDGLIDFS